MEEQNLEREKQEKVEEEDQGFGLPVDPINPASKYPSAHTHAQDPPTSAPAPLSIFRFVEIFV